MAEGHNFEVKEQFYLDGKPFQIISGGIHYFRVVPEYWRDRLEKLKAMGCNTVETYVPWNLHEEKEGCFDFSGRLDLKRFLEIAQELGLWAIVRPSPYICAEWEFGGLPAWLLSKKGIKIRTRQPEFLEYVRRYYRELFQILTPMQVTHGGPIVLMQVENEYGYYGDDTEYMEALKKIMEEQGADVPFVTSDGPMIPNLKNGALPGALATVNFGSKTKERFEVLKEYIGNKPLMCMEFWVGWFDAWGKEKHGTSNLEENKKDLKDLLEMGNVNFYMFHGGTNFGFMNGSNDYGHLESDVTSYDYDAILTEDGQLTEKYYAFRDIIKQYAPVPEMEFTTKITQKAYGMLTKKAEVSLFSVLDDISEKVYSPMTYSMEELGQNYGYILYRTQLKKGTHIDSFKLDEAGDRAILFADQKQIAVRHDRELGEECSLDFDADEVQFDILMENMGRVNFGETMPHQYKGIHGGVVINHVFHSGWDHYCLPFDNLEKLDFEKEAIQNTPSFYQFELEVEETADTFLDMAGWGKGCVFVNKFHVGRFWDRGPQKRLYVPAPLLKKGVNQIIIFETEGKSQETIEFCDKEDLGPTE